MAVAGRWPPVAAGKSIDTLPSAPLVGKLEKSNFDELQKMNNILLHVREFGDKDLSVIFRTVLHAFSW